MSAENQPEQNDLVTEKHLQELQLKKEIWEKAVDTQMHFNEMCVKSRQLGMTFVVAALGLAVVLLGREKDFYVQVNLPWRTFDVHVSAIIVLVAAAAVIAVRNLDLNVYHRMLRGAVTFGMEFEEAHLRKSLMGTQFGMTEFITLFSRHHKVTKTNGTWKGEDEKNAEKKLKNFYRNVIAVLLIIFVAILFSFKSPSEYGSQSVPKVDPAVEKMVTNDKS